MKTIRKQSKRLLGLLLSICMVLSLLTGMLPTMAAATEESSPANAVRYLDASGNECFVTDFTTVTSTTTTMADGWYVVKGSIQLAEKITLIGTVHLILCDKATLTTPGVLLAKGNSLSIYAQSKDYDTMGSLISQPDTNGQSAIGGFKGGSGELVINGGNISAKTTKSFSAAMGCGSSSGYPSAYSCDPITINGSFTQNGGIVLATCGHSDSPSRRSDRPQLERHSVLRHDGLPLCGQCYRQRRRSWCHRGLPGDGQQYLHLHQCILE